MPRSGRTHLAGGIVGFGMPRARGARPIGSGRTMKVLYTVGVWLVVAAHLVFLIYLPIGGFLALRWRRSMWVHVPVVLWAIGSAALHFECPLTWLERWGREHAGMAPLGSAGFIDHYLTGVLYPSGDAGYVQAAVFTLVLASWIGFAASARRAMRRDSATAASSVCRSGRAHPGTGPRRE